MSFKGWIEVIMKGTDDRPCFGLRGEGEPGRMFNCFEGSAPPAKDAIRDVLGLDFDGNRSRPLTVC